MPRAAAPSAPRFEHRTDAGPALGVGTAVPRLSWTVPEAEPGFVQRAREIQISRAGETVTAVVESHEQVLVPWPAEPLRSRERAEVRVRVRDDEWSGWSEAGVVEAGMLSPQDWTARFVSPGALGGLDRPAPVLRGEIDIPEGIVSARLYATAHGVYEAELNGRRVGDEVLAPGWTSYPNRLRYQSHDVTELVTAGRNDLTVTLGNGWYRGRLGFLGRRALYGDRLALLAQLEVTTADGAVHVLATDESWTAGESQVVYDDLYNGQHTDLRRPVPREPDGAVVIVDADLGLLVAPDGPPVRVTGVLPAVAVWTSPSGRTLVDFGQNIVGRVRLRTRGHDTGHEIVLRHAEVLDDGELGVRPLRTADATDRWILAGPGEVALEPTLTFHGFRYAEITGVEDLRAADVEAIAVGSDLKRTGWFDSSHELLNKFHENVVWGMRGNFLDVPTDCPQRDERLGWTGDIQVFSPTAAFLFDSTGFLRSWLADLAAEQLPNGAVPFVIPDVLHGADPAAAAWGDAAAVVPWVLYQRTGDLGVLAAQLPSMRAWVDRISALAGTDGLWAGGFQFGDWLDPTAPPEAPADSQADPDVVATAHLAHSADLVALAARALGETGTAEQYEKLAARTRDAFAREYVTGGGRVLSDSPTAYALALQWDLLPNAEQRRRAGARLADLVRASGFRISTGFVGTPLIADALTAAGEVGVAYRLLLQTGCPSWLYPVTMGATTVWERWDSMLPDGRINPGEMTSFNHYALGAVADWLHRTVAGLAPAAPGYRSIEVRPLPGSRLTHASARHLTPYGPAAVSWERAEGRFRLSVEVPVGVTAAVHLPDGRDFPEVGHGRHEWESADPFAEAVSGRRATVRDVLDDEPAWRGIVEAAVSAGLAADEAGVAASLRAHFDAPASSLVDALVPGDVVRGAEELRRVLGAAFDATNP
ncbi:family 78 glycoside hydrolase catalytic domain [Phytomonospora sp. NPDC050363]|uniref:family 78 glycoside hydrolase catalytic domain n=1 Tax=Phytomonospora sp. NPDC050363 TaxID=3155642 RepID=UPI0033E589E3